MNSYKCIFMDHDGVICLSNNWGGRAKKWSKYRSENPESSSDKRDAPVDVRFDDFDEKAVRILNQILEKQEQRLSSRPTGRDGQTWRRWGNTTSRRASSESQLH